MWVWFLVRVQFPVWSGVKSKPKENSPLVWVPFLRLADMPHYDPFGAGVKVTLWLIEVKHGPFIAQGTAPMLPDLLVGSMGRVAGNSLLGTRYFSGQ